MSKIAIKGNESGTATFTIEAPATNTDRIFELPDEAGKVLTTGNNDPAEVFKQANILGTVSQSGGVPTGAIIQRGSNANGEFIRYADGTLVCNTMFNFSTNQNSMRGAWVYPATFFSIGGIARVGAPSISVWNTNDGFFRDGRNLILSYTIVPGASPTDTVFRVDTNTSTNAGISRVFITQHGRWY